MATDSKVKVKLVRSPNQRDLITTEHLTTEQKQIVDHRLSPLLVLGGTGTGKTTTLVKAVANRILQGCDVNTILAITYGRQSANRLKDQIASANPQLHTVNEPIARTFHSIAFLILNDQLLTQENTKYVLLSGAEQDALITQLLAIDAQKLALNPGL